MYNKEIKEKLQSLYAKREEILKDINKEIDNTTKALEDSCDHKDNKSNYTIEYDSTYEMRSSEMHCIQCGKSGSRDELMNKEDE